MARVNINQAPYYDDYDSSKQYTQLLALPGRVAQAREFTQLQSTLKNSIKELGNSIFKDGNVVEGCQVIVNEAKTSATVTSGRVYLNGMILEVSETSVPISGTGTEIIGAKLMEAIITEADDNTLKDPAQGYDNYNQPGCHRVRSWITITVNDNEASALATLVDGELSIETYAPNYDTLTQTLARRTHDESGSYIVDGLTVRIEASDNPSNFTVVVEPGKAYVLGYELRILTPKKYSIGRSTTYDPVLATNYWYDEDVDDYLLASAPYVKEITQVKGFVSKTVNQTISNNTDRVLFDELEVSQISSVTQGATTYTVGNSDSTGDCYLQREGSRYYLKWNGTANYPTLNTSYSVTYIYNHTFINNTDYELSLVDDKHYLSWLGASTPIDGTNFTVAYNQYLARKDSVYIDRYGNINITRGIPAEYGFEVLPDKSANTLELAHIYNPPGGLVTSNSSQSIQVYNVGLTRFTMNDIQNLLNRIRTIEYDQTVLSLNDEARQYETATSKRGIFTDPLVDLARIDYYYNMSGSTVVDPSKPVYDVTIDTLKNICYLPTAVDMQDMIASNTSTAKLYNKAATLSKSGESVILTQLKATKSYQINPYSVFPQLPEISLSPSSDSWVEDNVITVPVSHSTTEILTTSTRNIELTSVISGRFTSYKESTTATVDTAIGVKVSTSSQESVINQESVMYIRQREITVEGINFPPTVDNIRCYFDGVLVALTPTGSTLAGTMSGSVKADNNGYLSAKFTIPANILTGIREVKLESAAEVAGYNKSASALYQANGTIRNIRRTITTLTTILLNRVTTISTRNYVDPVGQTFVLDKMTIINAIDLYFEAKPAGSVPVTCEIREVVNGSISSTIYGHKTLAASEVSVSSDSRTATRFVFENPVLLEENIEYAFVIRSTSPSYRIWVADLGGLDIISGDVVLANPYLIGVMMSSSNNSSWSMHQTTDVKFRLIADTYAQSSDLIFNQIAGLDFSRIYLLADYITPSGTSIDWYYSVDGGVNYKTISPYNIILLDQLKTTFDVKATLRRDSNSTLSPIVALDTIGCSVSKYDTEGYYITQNISGLDAYTKVDIILDTYIPSNTSLTVYVSNDNGTTLEAATLDNLSVKTLNFGWKEQTYKATVSSATQCKLFIKLESDYEYFTPSFRRVRMVMY